MIVRGVHMAIRRSSKEHPYSKTTIVELERLRKELKLKIATMSVQPGHRQELREIEDALVGVEKELRESHRRHIEATFLQDVRD